MQNESRPRTDQGRDTLGQERERIKMEMSRKCNGKSWRQQETAVDVHCRFVKDKDIDFEKGK